MKRILFLLPFVLLAAFASAQKARLDSLLRVLKTQPDANADRMNTLTALGKTYSTIDLAKASDAAKEAGRIAERIKSDDGRIGAWISERWVAYYTGDIVQADSLNRLAEALAERTKNEVQLAVLRMYLYSDEDLDTPAAKEKYLDRFRRSLEVLRKANAKADLAEALAWFGFNSVFNTTADSLDRARALYEELGDKSGIAFCLMLRDTYEPYLSDPHSWELDLAKAVELYTADGNVYWAMGANLNWAMGLVEEARYQEAVQRLLVTLPLAQAFGSSDSEGLVYWNLGRMYTAMNEPQKALENYTMGSAFKQLGLPCLIGMGEAWVQAQQPDSALACLQRAIAAHAMFGGDDLYTGEINGFLGDAYSMKGELAKAAEHYETAVAIHSKYPLNYAQEIKYSLGLGRLLLEADDRLLAQRGLNRGQAHDRAQTLFARALARSKEMNVRKLQQEALLSLSRLYEGDGDLRKALDYHQQYAVMKDSVLNADKAKAVANLQIQYETEKKEQEILLLGKDKEVQAKEIQKQKLVRNGFIGGFALVALFASLFLFQRNRIGKEKKRSEELLLNILPAEVAEELKAKGSAEAVHIDLVTVLFTDFKGFTAMSEVVTPAQLVRDLNECFSAFDHITEKYGIEKIKTIGDAYMAAGGLPTPNTTHATDVIKAALEMRDFIAEGKARKIAAGLPYFEIRIGVHTGPVVAGIVGVKKFSYDIWGDTVNTASRMESSGEVGQVNISEATHALVKDTTGFTFTPRGKVQAKGKGEMEMYFVERT
ncbi:MAG: adenylate/guanylate cyclase domain-containing protein [Flavobacteriales bacterium]